MPKVVKRKQLRGTVHKRPKDKNKKEVTDEAGAIQQANAGDEILRPEAPRNVLEDVEIIDRHAEIRNDVVEPVNYNDENMNDNHHDAYVTWQSKLFDRIKYSDEALSALPNRSWAIHSCDVPVKKIIVSEVVMHNVYDNCLEPFYNKQIVIDEKLNFEVFLLKCRTVLKDRNPFISSMEDFEALMDHLQSLRLCSGGPYYQQYNNVSPECAFRDPTDKWRHNLCTFEVIDADTCESCLSLEDILKKQALRSRPAVKSKNTNNNNNNNNNNVGRVLRKQPPS